MARLSRGAYHSFHSGAADQLRALLQAVGAYATGGVKALQDLHTDSARRLLGPMRRNGAYPKNSDQGAQTACFGAFAYGLLSQGCRRVGGLCVAGLNELEYTQLGGYPRVG